MDGESLRILLTVLGALGASLWVRWVITRWLWREQDAGDDWTA